MRTFLPCRPLIALTLVILVYAPVGSPQESPEPESSGIGALIDGTGMVAIAAGEFRMGSDSGNPDEQPVHRIRITRAFEIGKFEVTQAQWQTVMTQAHSRSTAPLLNDGGMEVSKAPSHFKGASLPVDSVSWDDVQLFLKRLNVEGRLYSRPYQS
jgi:formylglycine-generating enzyme required for sulfatase activity